MKNRLHPLAHCGVSVWATLTLLALACSPAFVGATPEAALDAAPTSERLSALLINGGARRQSNYYSHLDHLRRLTAMLQASGVDPANIAVFSGDGADPAADLATREGDLPDAFWLLPRREARRLRPPIEYVNSEIDGFTLRPATNAALGAWFETEAKELVPGDTLFLYVTDHGEADPDGNGNTRISLWGEELSVSELREQLASIHPGVRVVMLMSQCYSGGFANLVFADDVASVPAGNVCGYFSAPPDRKAHGCYPEVSGVEAVGHSHRMFEALGVTQRLPDAHREVLVSDGTPDVPNATSGFFLDRLLGINAAKVDLEPDDFIDLLLEEAWQDPLAWEPEIRLLDRVGQTFGFSSLRSLAQLEKRAEGLAALRDQLNTYAGRWDAALDALRVENVTAFHEANPGLKESVKASALQSLAADERRKVIDAYLTALVAFTGSDPERQGRLVDMHWKAEEAKAARYRADVRVAAVLRMRALLMQVAGRHFLTYHADEIERSAFGRLERCEDLTLVSPETTSAGTVKTPEPFPTLAQERRQIEAIIPGWLGLHYNAPDKEARERHDLPPGASAVTAVLPGSPAEAAEFKVTDIVLGPPEAPFQERHEMREWVMQSTIGAPLPVRVLRDDEELTLTVRLAPFPIEMPELPGPPQVGSVAPPLELDFLPDSGQPAPGESKLLFFWATWCNPCKKSLPELLAFAEDRNIDVVSITDEKPDVVSAFLREFDGDFPSIVASDRHREQFQKYGVSGTPTFVLVDGEGVVQHVQAGYKVGNGLRIDGWQWQSDSESGN